VSKFSALFRVPRQYRADSFEDIFKDIATQLNSLAEGRITARYLSNTAAPSTGNWEQGDYVPNSAPSEAGSAGGMYVLMGWVCVSSGTPGTWKEVRTLTGN